MNYPNLDDASVDPRRNLSIRIFSPHGYIPANKTVLYKELFLSMVRWSSSALLDVDFSDELRKLGRTSGIVCCVLIYSQAGYFVDGQLLIVLLLLLNWQLLRVREES